MKKLFLASITLSVLAFIFLVSQTGCTKSDPVRTDSTSTVCKHTIVGLWTGSSTNVAGSGQAWSVSIRPDGTVSYENTIHDTRQLAVGSWELKHDTLTFTTVGVYGYSIFQGAVQTWTAKYDSTTGTLSNGTYVTTSPSADSGTFTLTEVNNTCTPAIQGLWTGSSVNAAGSGQAWSVSLRPDGTASYENTIYDTRQLAVGTWTLKNDTLTFSTVAVYGYSIFQGTEQTWTAKYNATTGTLTNGTYVTTYPAADSGTFTLTVVQ
ncbi:hypothetical protein SIO70_05165 [Chitinophaga sancti]|uniref:hypothetical protein n=1 Tax=Chitinophaga sancti TaxID=1004 RepID=UPI002A757D3E|nr:hypothetical protein [Chitinophaga sancti]WPQ64253.1 hypothetical protein SIO70_05165 [Chitinophaga sancti]